MACATTTRVKTSSAPAPHEAPHHLRRHDARLRGTEADAPGVLVPERLVDGPQRGLGRAVRQHAVEALVRAARRHVQHARALRELRHQRLREEERPFHVRRHRRAEPVQRQCVERPERPGGRGVVHHHGGCRAVDTVGDGAAALGRGHVRDDGVKVVADHPLCLAQRALAAAHAVHLDAALAQRGRRRSANAGTGAGDDRAFERYGMCGHAEDASQGFHCRARDKSRC